MRSVQERKRLMLIVLPVVLFAFLALAFYALGGGRGDSSKLAGGSGKGLNAELPAASFKKEKKEDKFSLYEQAERDSGRHFGAGGAFAALGWDTAAYRRNEAVKSGSSNSSFRSGGLGYNSAKENEAKIKEKLAEIDRQVRAPALPVAPVRGAVSGVPGSPDMELARLEKMLKQQPGMGASAPDPELERLNGMLDKIVQIQNPGLGKGTGSAAAPVKPLAKDSAFRAVPAVVDGNQKVLQGGMVRLRLTDSLVLGSLRFQKGTLLFGSCTITNQRLLLDIRNIRLGTAIVPVSLTVFSLDGMQGIDAPSAELGEAAGQGTANALDNMAILGMDQSLATQAATAGISAAKGLIGRKVRRVKVRLKGGYPVLLRNNAARN